MLRLRAALDGLTVSKDGVDGKGIYLYGEGWNFGEVANDARFVQATQQNMAGTGIGTFTDRLRDAVRGGGPFDDDPRIQGFGDGLFTDPNGDRGQRLAGPAEGRLLHDEDLIKLGLAGNLAYYPFTDSTGALGHRARRRLQRLSPPGYAADPSETVTYVDAHDNETLFDALQYEAAAGHLDGRPGADEHRLAGDDRARPRAWSFWHAGADLLRSKSLDRNSLDSGDWFNRVDWSPPREHLRLGPAAGGATTAPSGTYMRAAARRPGAQARPRGHGRGARAGRSTCCAIRFSSPAVPARQRRGDPAEGVLPGRRPRRDRDAVDDTVGADVDPALSGVLVVFNASPSASTVDGVGHALDAAHRCRPAAPTRWCKQSASTADGAVTVPARHRGGLRPPLTPVVE